MKPEKEFKKWKERNKKSIDLYLCRSIASHDSTVTFNNVWHLVENIFAEAYLAGCLEDANETEKTSQSEFGMKK